MSAPPRTNSVEKHFFSKANLTHLIPGRVRKAKHIAGLIQPFLKGKTIRSALSIGSSYCIIEDYLKQELIPQAEFICTDLDERALTCYPEQDLIKYVMSATDLKFPAESFDLIIAHQVLEHINDYPVVLQSLRRLCRPGGLIYINVPNPRSPMIGTLPNGEWPRPIFKELLLHNLKKFNADFMLDTEKYHTGFTIRTLKKYLPEFEIYDLRKARLKQGFRHPAIQTLIDWFPRCLLFVVMTTNIWLVQKRRRTN